MAGAEAAAIAVEAVSLMLSLGIDAAAEEMLSAADACTCDVISCGVDAETVGEGVLVTDSLGGGFRS